MGGNENVDHCTEELSITLSVLRIVGFISLTPRGKSRDNDSWTMCVPHVTEVLTHGYHTEHGTWLDDDTAILKSTDISLLGETRLNQKKPKKKDYTFSLFSQHVPERHFSEGKISIGIGIQ